MAHTARSSTGTTSSTLPSRWRLRRCAQMALGALTASALFAVALFTVAQPAEAQFGEVYGKLIAYGGHDGGGWDTRAGGYQRWEWTPGSNRLETSTAHPTVALGESAKSFARVFTALIPTEPLTHLNVDAHWKGYLRSGAAQNSNAARASVDISVRVYEMDPDGGFFGLPVPIGDNIFHEQLFSDATNSGSGYSISGSTAERYELPYALTPGRSYRVELGINCSSTTTIAIFVESATCDFQFTPYTPFLGSPIPDNGYGVYLNRWYFENLTPLGPPCNGLDPTVLIAEGHIPTEGDDVIIGTTGDDIIDGLGGNDTICGLDGNDEIRGSDGDDYILGEGGDDKLFGGKGVDQIFGGSGGDILHGNRGADRLYGESGDDRIFGYSENDYIDGGDGADRLHGNRGDDTILGGADDDAIFGYADNDQLLGGAGDDLIGGNFGDDQILGEVGNDRIYGSDGADVVFGGAGNDLVEGNSGDDEVVGGSGDDVLDGGINVDSCDGGDGTDEATRCETITGIP